MSFSAARVNEIASKLYQKNHTRTQEAWLRTVCTYVWEKRPDIALHMQCQLLGLEPNYQNLLDGMSIGEIGACYEALLALTNRESRKRAGQFFTPDDAAQFMARQSLDFPRGVWLDPCCGVGNLAWHLAAVQDDPADFVAHRLTLMDIDPVALKTAIALIACEYLPENDCDGFDALMERSIRGNFLVNRTLQGFDYVIVNPPYARAPEQKGYLTGGTQEYFAYFLERIARQAHGFISVTPASYVSAPKYQVLRDILDSAYQGGRVYVFDNVPDTFFRGYKYGSTNTSTTNFVRAAVTVCSPQETQWQITPIMRWQAVDRPCLWQGAEQMLSPRIVGPHGQWVKLLPGMGAMWESLAGSQKTVGDLLVSQVTPYHLDLALTPRYYISAAFRSLERGSKVTLHFSDEAARDLAAMVLNSSLPYLWWRALDGGVTLTMTVLKSVPIPSGLRVQKTLLHRLREAENSAVVVKINAGRKNENIKHSPELVRDLDAVVLPQLTEEQRELLYSNSMFSA